MGTSIKLHRLGRRAHAEGIEPSCGVLDIIKDGAIQSRIVIDCGHAPVPGFRNSRQLPAFGLFEDGKKIDAVCITHVHADHVGGLTGLVPFLAPKAKVFWTKGSNALALTVLTDGLGHGGEDDGAERLRIRNILNRTAVIRQPGVVEILPGVNCYVNPEGHISGACSFTFDVAGTKVHYSGDRCEHWQPAVRGALPLPDEWLPRVIAGSDCTYGADPDSDKRDWREEMRRGSELCRRTLERGAPVLLCAFGVHRGGVVGHMLQEAGIPKVGDVFIDGKCRDYANIVKSGLAKWSACDEDLDIKMIKPVEKRGRVANSGFPYAVISTPGMGGPGGAATYWRRHILENPAASLIFTGYIAPHTDGDLLLQAAKERAEKGSAKVTFRVEDLQTGGEHLENYDLKCEVEQIRIGSHDSRGRILDWFRRLHPEIAVLSHGSQSSLDSLEAELGQDGKIALHRADAGALQLDL